MREGAKMQKRTNDIVTNTIVVTAPNNLKGQNYIDKLSKELKEANIPFIRRKSTKSITVKWDSMWEI